MLSRPPNLLPFDHCGAEQLQWHEATGEVTFAAPLGQSFRCTQDALYRIEVFVEPTFHYKRCHLWLQLFDGDVTALPADEGPAPVRIAEPLAAEKLIAHGWLSFEFQPIARSAGKTFCFVLAAPDATPGNALAFRASARHGRGLSVGGRPRPGALLFRAICQRAPALLPNFRRYLRAARDPGGPVDHTPLMVQIEASRPCNLHCVMCHRGLTPFDSRREATAFMSLATFQALDAILPDLLWIIAFGLGEPFLNPQYLSLLRHARGRNPFVHVFTSTNGTCLDDEMLEAIVREQLLSTLQISIDGAERATFEAIRRNASYATVFDCLERIVATRARRRSEMRVRASMLVMKPTAGQVFQFIRQMADVGVDLISLGTPKDDAFKSLRADTPDEMARIYEQVVRGHQSLAGSGAMLDGPLLAELFEWHRRTGQTDIPPRWGHDETAVFATGPASRPTACGVPWESFNFSADGAVRVCCNSYRQMGRSPPGAFAQLWQRGQPYGQLRTELLTRELHSDCRACLAGSSVTADQVTPAIYRHGTIADSGVTALRAKLLGAPIDATKLDELPGFMLALEDSGVEPEEDPGTPWRIRGWLHARAGFGAMAENFTLAIAVDGVVRGLATALVVSPHFAQFSAVVAPATRPAGARRLEVFQIDRQAGELHLRRFALSPSPANPDEPAPWLRPREAPPRARAEGSGHGFIDDVKIEAGLLHLIGWARDARRRTPASRVVALVDGRPVRSVRPWLSRPDVVRAYSDPPAMFGFALELPVPRYSRGVPHSISALALDDRGAARPLEWGFQETIIAQSSHVAMHFRVDHQVGWITHRVPGPAAALLV